MKIAISNFTLYKERSTMLATADVTLANTSGVLITVRDIKLIKGRVGAFMAAPTKKVGDRYEPIVVFEDENIKKKLQQMLTQLYEQSSHNLQ